MVLKMQLSLESEVPQIGHDFHRSNHLFSIEDIEVIHGRLSALKLAWFHCSASGHDADLDVGVAASKGENKRTDGQIDTVIFGRCDVESMRF